MNYLPVLVAPGVISISLRILFNRSFVLQKLELLVFIAAVAIPANDKLGTSRTERASYITYCLISRSKGESVENEGLELNSSSHGFAMESSNISTPKISNHIFPAGSIFREARYIYSKNG